MTDLLLPYVDRLIQLQKGNKDTMLKIQRACQQNEILSISERDYIAKLAKQYLGEYTDPYATATSSFIPSTSPTLQPNISKPMSQSMTHTGKSTIQIHKIKSKLPFVKIGIALGVLCVIGILGVVILNNTVATDFDDIFNIPSITPTSEKLPLSLDQSTYRKGDIISVYGVAATPNVTITVTMQGLVVWSEIVDVYDGVFSTLLIAGGPNWRGSGVYVVEALVNTTSYTLNFDFVD